MGQVFATIEIESPLVQTYQYLHDRYQSMIYKTASSDAKGYIGNCVLIEEKPNTLLKFKAAGRDSLTKIKTSSWIWVYELTKMDEKRTKVKICYQWGLWLAFLSMGTIKMQAANEIVETALALLALEQGGKGVGKVV